MDIGAMSIGELRKLSAAIEKEISTRQKQHRNKALGELKSVAAKYGLKLDDVVGKSAVQKKRRKVQKKDAIEATEKLARKAKNILYRHPENPELTWSGGRGRRPQWVKDWEASGRNIEEARIGDIESLPVILPRL